MSYPPQTDGVVSSELFTHTFYQPAVWIRRQRQNTSSLSEPGSTTHKRGKLASRSVRLLFSISFSVVAALRQMLRLSMQVAQASSLSIRARSDWMTLSPLAGTGSGGGEKAKACLLNGPKTTNRSY